MFPKLTRIPFPIAALISLGGCTTVAPLPTPTSNPEVTINATNTNRGQVRLIERFDFKMTEYAWDRIGSARDPITGAVTKRPCMETSPDTGCRFSFAMDVGDRHTFVRDGVGGFQGEDVSESLVCSKNHKLIEASMEMLVEIFGSDAISNVHYLPEAKANQRSLDKPR